MALSVSVTRTDTVGRYTKYKTGTITFDSSYATGGEALSASNCGLSAKVEFLSATNAAGYIFEYDYTNGKLKAYYPSKSGTITSPGLPGAEVAASTDLSGVTCRFIAFGY